jgi:hypothetical protein
VSTTRTVGSVAATALRDAFDRFERARVPRRLAHEPGVDAVRHGIAERERVRRQEQRAQRDRQGRDDGGPLGRRPRVVA